MSPRLSAPPASSPPPMIPEAVHDESKSGRIGHLISPARRLASKFIENPRWGVMFTLGRLRFVSSAVVFFHRGQVVRPPASVPSVFPSLDVEQALQNMRRDGIHQGVNLSREAVDDITQFALSTECYWPGDPSVRFLPSDRPTAERAVGKPILLGRYYDIQERCASIKAIANDPILHYMAASYMGAPAGQIEARLWWSFVAEASSADRIKADQGFHYDLHDYRSIAFFFHITDVDELSGPHVHVRGSHTHKPLRLLFGDTRQSTEEDLVKHYGADNIMTICGGPGFGFSTDPFGYHKGAAPLAKDRLILRVRFTINDDGSRLDRSGAFGPPTDSKPS